MKKAVAVVVPLLLVVAAILLFRHAQLGGGAREDDEKPRGTTVEHTNATPAGGVELSAEQQLQAGLTSQAIAAETLPRTVHAFGNILDPSGLVSLDNELSDAEAALTLSEAQLSRAQTLFAQNQSVPQKALEGAEAQVRSDRNKLRATRRKLELDWGSTIAALDATNRLQLINQLLQRGIALARVEIPIAVSVGETLSAAKINPIGYDHTIDAAIFSEATVVDPHTQGRGILLRIDKPPGGLRPGTAVESQLATTGPATTGPAMTGWQIPRSAVIRHLGRTWIYLQKVPDKFLRIPIQLQELSGDHWFSTDTLDAQDRVVATGAQVLLSEELKSQLAPGD